MRVLTFSGVLLDTGDMQLEPGFVIDAESPSREGEITVEALGRDGRAIATTQVPLDTPCGYPTANAAGQPPQVAVGLVEFPEKASGLRVIYDGRTVLERTAPRAGGEPKVEWPPALATDTVSVRWRAGEDGSMASLGYSNDGGETWAPLSLPTADETITFDASALPGGDRCLLELIASDGFHTTRTRSDEYQVKPKGWALWILSPAPGASLSSGAPVLLAAQSYHLEERRPGSEPITWTSSLDGGLGEDAQVMAALSPGEHTITATMSGISSQVQVTVVA
jgi:hypothetical protein